jgi:hypothetical protein
VRCCVVVVVFFGLLVARVVLVRFLVLFLAVVAMWLVNPSGLVS